jgi:hypothetical protein
MSKQTHSTNFVAERRVCSAKKGAWKSILLSGIMCLCLCSSVHAAVWYIDKDNDSGTEDGTTWATAFTTFRPAIIAASEGDELWVAEGVYDEERNDNTRGALVPWNSVQVYGGFSGVETQRNERDWETHVTVIDGSVARAGQAAYHVIMGKDGARIDGFTITGGVASGSSSASHGAAVSLVNAEMVLKNCIISDNTGEPIFAETASLTMTNCTVFDNYGSASHSWGYVLTLLDSQATLTDCNLSGNTGTAIDAFRSLTQITGCTISENTGRALDCQSGSMTIRESTFSNYALESDSIIYANGPESFILEDSVIEGNEIKIHNDGGILKAGSFGNYQIRRCIFRDNVVTSNYNNGAGAISGAADIEDCLFMGNRAIGQAQAMSGAVQGGGRIRRCIFVGNRADKGATALRGSWIVTSCLFYGNTADDMSTSGSLSCIRDVSSIVNCTITGNTGNTEAVIVPNELTKVVNSIFWGNDGVVAQTELFAEVSIAYSTVEGGYPGEGNLDLDPLFVDVASNDYRLRWDSPCFNTGLHLEEPDLDLAGLARPIAAAFDMGAYEMALQDEDHDGADDNWELVHGFDPVDPLDGQEDADGDGVPNVVEFEFTSDPFDATDPHIPTKYRVSPQGDDESGEGPFRTIGHAMNQAGLWSMYKTAAIYLEEGVYEEPVNFAENVEVWGNGEASTIISFYDGGSDENVVVTGAEGAMLADCAVTSPGFHTGDTILVLIDDVSMPVKNVLLDGNDNLNTLGVLIGGAASNAKASLRHPGPEFGGEYPSQQI